MPLTIYRHAESGERNHHGIIMPGSAGLYIEPDIIAARAILFICELHDDGARILEKTDGEQLHAEDQHIADLSGTTEIASINANYSYNLEYGDHPVDGRIRLEIAHLALFSNN